jgi:hypothetical protein
MALICIVFASLGTAIGSTLQNMQGFQLIMTARPEDVRSLPQAHEPALA